MPSTCHISWDNSEFSQTFYFGEHKFLEFLYYRYHVYWSLTYEPQRGGDLPGMVDLRLVERLSVLISGGTKQEVCLCPHIYICLMLRQNMFHFNSHDYGLLWQWIITWSHNNTHVLIACFFNVDRYLCIVVLMLTLLYRCCLAWLHRLPAISYW